MVLSGKPPDYNQRGNRNETNSSVAMETVGKFFLSLSLQTPVNASFHFEVFFFLLLMLIFNMYFFFFFFTINLSLSELERQRLQFLYEYKVHWDEHPRLTFKLNFSLCVTEQIAIALEPNWTATAFGS